ncbi:MAG: C-GCAxxG-C-C family protein [Spirochaetaceae bacterium]|nr:C-GCAxxG-C-C family protein [Spirochaetaceae bacterium]
MTHSELALTAFDAGCDCGKAIIRAYETETILDERSLARLHEDVPGLPGHPEDECGIVTGADIVIQTLRGLKASPTTASEFSRTFKERFIALNESACCKRLLGYDVADVRELGQAIDADAFDHVCRKLMADACSILDGMIAAMPAPTGERRAPRPS